MAWHRLRRRTFPTWLRPLAGMGLAAVALLAVPGGAIAAGKAGTLRLSGRVPPHAALRLSEWTLTPVALRAAPSGEGVAVAGLALLANNRQFSLTLRSLGAIVTGRPSLVDPATGRRMAYSISYGGIALQLAGGELVLDDLLASASGPADLEVSLPRDARIGSGQFQDRLVLEIAAR